MRFSDRLARMEATQAGQNARLQAVQGQVSIVSSMLKETVVFQQLIYQAGIVSHDDVKAELDRLHTALAEQLEKIGEATAVQSKDTGASEGDRGSSEPGVSRDACNGGDSTRQDGPRIWTPGGLH